MMPEKSDMTEDHSSHRFTSLRRVLEIVAIISGIVGIVGGIAGISSFILQWQDRQEGLRDEPEIRLQLGQHEVEEEATTRVFLGAPLNEDNAVNVGHLPLGIANTGERTAEDISVVDRYPKVGRPFLHENLDFFDFGVKEGFLPPGAKIHHATKEVGPYSFIYYSIPSINPHSGV